MDGKHPVRKKDKYNPYELTVENEQYYVIFYDGQGIQHKERITQELYELFNRFELEDISQLNKISRYHEQSELTEGTLNQRTLLKPIPMEDAVFNKIMCEKLHTAISKLPAVQRRRIILYYFESFTYEQIAMVEGCTHQAVNKSILAAEKKLKKYFSN